MLRQHQLERVAVATVRRGEPRALEVRVHSAGGGAEARPDANPTVTEIPTFGPMAGTIRRAREHSLGE